MQLSRFDINGLFGLHDYSIPFPTTAEESAEPAVVILHGYNGVGKTTILKMIDGIMKLDYNAFRAVPFRDATLFFNSGEYLKIAKLESRALQVNFRGWEVELHPDHGGPQEEDREDEVEAFRAAFTKAVQPISFEFLSDARSALEANEFDSKLSDYERIQRFGFDRPVRSSEKQILAAKVKEFLRNAQLDSKAFFRSGEPELFDRIIEDLTQVGRGDMTAGGIRKQLLRVREMEEMQIGFDLRIDKWDFERLDGLLQNSDPHTLSVIGTYAELLLSRAESRQFVVDRLVTFEKVMLDFLHDKSVKITASKGLSIISDSGQLLREGQLSSGEYQLLYLMVAALTTRRRGTVIAIDEPELSMHVEWQRKLVPSLIECASRANPQFFLATHSPDVAASYSDKLVVIGRGVPGAKKS